MPRTTPEDAAPADEAWRRELTRAVGPLRDRITALEARQHDLAQRLKRLTRQLERLCTARR
jgi:chaperonin cofactor prefoldin